MVSCALTSSRGILIKRAERFGVEEEWVVRIARWILSAKIGFKIRERACGERRFESDTDFVEFCEYLKIKGTYLPAYALLHFYEFSFSSRVRASARSS
jgi:hypothetical protein